MKTLKICFVLFGLFFLSNGYVKAQKGCPFSVSVTSLPENEQVPLNADNSIDIPITVESSICELTLQVSVKEVGRIGRPIAFVINNLPTGMLQTTITIPNTSVDTEYLVRCGSVEHGLNDGGCTIIVVP